MDWLGIIGIIIVGIVLILIELIFFPGTTIFGIFGLVCMGIGIFYGYDQFGSSTGNYILAGSALLTGTIILYGLRGKSWDKFALKSKSESRFNDQVEINLNVGDEGKSISYLRPSGKAEFNSEEFEVFALDEFISSETPIVIVKIDNRKIFVKPKS